MIGVIWAVTSVALVLCLTRAIKRVVDYYDALEKYNNRYGGDKGERPKLKLPGLVIVAVLVLALYMLSLPSSTAQIPATHMGVLENTLYGTLEPLQPGTYVWPFTPQLWPFVTKVTLYDLRRQVVEIGVPDPKVKAPDGLSATQFFGVPSASSSLGQPIVFFHARGWASPNPATLTMLHRRYGPTYLDTWVEPQWVTTLKNVQRVKPYDYVKTNALDLQIEVEDALEEHLSDGSTALVLVSQLAVIDYDYETKINDSLRAVADKEFERQLAQQQLAVNQKQQEAERVRVETIYIIKKREAEAEGARLEAEADGRAKAVKIEAAAAAYRIFATYEAEAKGIALVMAQIGTGDKYIQYIIAQEWDGQLPSTWFNGMAGTTPLLQIPIR